MGESPPYLTVAVILAALMGFLARLTAHDSHHEIRAQADRKAPLTTPDEPWRTSRRRASRPRRGH
ncbi:hypothetical protein NKH77_23750 [Streptomyces sp. M19]